MEPSVLVSVPVVVVRAARRLDVCVRLLSFMSMSAVAPLLLASIKLVVLLYVVPGVVVFMVLLGIIVPAASLVLPCWPVVVAEFVL